MVLNRRLPVLGRYGVFNADCGTFALSVIERHDSREVPYLRLSSARLGT